METLRANKYVVISLVAHFFVLLFFVLSFDFTAPLPVLENTNQHDVISAVVLGDTEKSKILPMKQPAKPLPAEVNEKSKPEPAQKLQVHDEAIALKAAEKKKREEKKLQEQLAKELLADVQKQSEKKKKIKQKELKAQFEKTLREQAEKSLRQQLLNEDIKLQGAKSRQSQGEVNKYKALILQAISEHWVVPAGVNKKLTAELTIHLAPGGVVLDVQITRGSGDPSLDSSARAAVMKASPLPVPVDSGEFDSFRHFVLKVKPENILPGEGEFI